jgi:hypothetical protein
VGKGKGQKTNETGQARPGKAEFLGKDFHPKDAPQKPHLGFVGV